MAKSKIDTNTLLIVGAIGVGAYFFLNKGSGNKERYFIVPGYGSVPESQLPSLGYIRINGQWIKESVYNAQVENYVNNGGQQQGQQWITFLASIVGIIGALDDAGIFDNSKKYNVPGVGQVSEPELESHGYIMVSGYWVKESIYEQALQTYLGTGQPSSGAIWQNWLTSVPFAIGYLEEA